jgi:hypothetical protein
MVTNTISIYTVIREAELLENILEYEYYMFSQMPVSYYGSKSEKQDFLGTIKHNLANIVQSIEKFRRYAQ